MTDFQARDRVRVTVHRGGRHLRNFYGSVIGMTKNGEVTVLEDRKTKTAHHNIDHVNRLTK